MPAVSLAPDVTVRRFEIGGKFTDFTLGTPGQIDVPKFALGPEFALNLSQHLALDVSYSAMSLPSCFLTTCSGGRESVFIAGARAEARDKRYGMFVYGRPGIFHTNAWTESQSYVSPAGPATLTSSSPGSSLFVSDVGGGVEYFAHYRLRARVELGDLLQLQTCAQCKIWTNHLQFSTGLYAAIGQPVAGGPFDADGEGPHRFLDNANLLLLLVSMLGQSADAITTQRFRSHGSEEQDPLERPFVDQGWAGQVGVAAIENAAQIFVMYRLHKLGHHRIERLVPLASGLVGGHQAYHNLQLQ